MLERSHRRLEERLGELRDAVAHIAAGAGDDDDLEVVDDVLAFLTRSVMRHEADEEESVFPRLAGTRALDALIAQLTADHKAQRRLVERARAAWSGEGTSRVRGRKLLRLCDQLESSYRAHVDREDRRLLPALRTELDADDRRAIAREMQARRGRVAR